MVVVVVVVVVPPPIMLTFHIRDFCYFRTILWSKVTPKHEVEGILKISTCEGKIRLENMPFRYIRIFLPVLYRIILP
jgi:hypothetical protein